jgi:hypothetical protein
VNAVNRARLASIIKNFIETYGQPPSPVSSLNTRMASQDAVVHTEAVLNALQRNRFNASVCPATFSENGT